MNEVFAPGAAQYYAFLPCRIPREILKGDKEFQLSAWETQAGNFLTGMLLRMQETTSDGRHHLRREKRPL